MYYTVQEVAELLKLSRRSVYRMIDAGRLEATRVGREWRISAESLASLLGETEARTQKPDRVAEASATYQVAQVHRPERPTLAGFMTAEEFVARPEGYSPANLIHGLLVRDPAPTISHQELVGRLYLVLHGAIREQGLGVVYLSPIDVILDIDTVLQPDLLVISNERREVIGERIQGAPDLVVEVASPSTEERDLTTKRLLYARYGVSECWFISGRERRLIQFWQPKDDHYRNREIHEAPDSVASARFPGLVLNLDSLFKEYTA